MFNEVHDLAKEFPEYKERIHELKGSDAHFAKLFREYQELDKKLLHIEQEAEPASNEAAEALKKQRVQLKDRLFAMLKAAA